MTFSVATSWLLPMNDRPHVKVSISVPGDVAGSEKAHELSEYFRTLPEYSIVEVVCFSGGIKAAPTGASRYGYVGAVVYGKEHTSKMPFDNLLDLMDYSYDVVDGSEVTEGVGFCIPARDVQHAIVRVVPDMTEIRDEDDLDHYNEEMDRVMEEVERVGLVLGGAMPDGSLLGMVMPAGSPDPDSGDLVDWARTSFIYHGRPYPLPVGEIPPMPHPPGQDDDGGDDSGGDDSGGDDGGNNDPN